MLNEGPLQCGDAHMVLLLDDRRLDIANGRRDAGVVGHRPRSKQVAAGAVEAGQHARPDARQRERRQAVALRSSGADLVNARITSLEKSLDILQATIGAIPNEATLAQAGAELRLATLNALADVVDVMTTTRDISLPEGATTRPQR